MKKTLVILLAVIAFSCAALRVTPVYSPQAVEMVQTATESTNQLYNDIMNSHDKTYDQFESAYMSVARQINDILILDSSRDKAKIILIIANDIKKRFTKYTFEHESSGTINSAQAQSYKDGMNALWKSLYNAEINYKP